MLLLCGSCCGPCGTHCVTVKRSCDGAGIGAGATVTLKLSGATVSTCTTDSSSQCCLDVPSAGSGYSIEVTAPSGSHYANKTVSSLTLACGSTTRNITLDPDTGYACFGCTGVVLPTGVVFSSLTDSTYGTTSSITGSSVGSLPAGLIEIAAASYAGGTNTKCFPGSGCTGGSTATCASATMQLLYQTNNCDRITVYYEWAPGLFDGRNCGCPNGGPVSGTFSGFGLTYKTQDVTFALTGYTTSPNVLTFGGAPTSGCGTLLYPAGWPTITMTFT